MPFYRDIICIEMIKIKLTHRLLTAVREALFFIRLFHFLLASEEVKYHQIPQLQDFHTHVLSRS